MSRRQVSGNGVAEGLAMWGAEVPPRVDSSGVGAWGVGGFVLLTVRGFFEPSLAQRSGLLRPDNLCLVIS